MMHSFARDGKKYLQLEIVLCFGDYQLVEAPLQLHLPECLHEIEHAMAGAASEKGDSNPW